MAIRLGPGDTSASVHAIEGGSEASVANSKLVLNLLIAQTPLEHQGAHTKALARAAEGDDHLLDIIVTKDATPSTSHATHGALALVLEELAQHLIEELEVGLGDAELLAQLRDDIAGEGLLVADALAETCFNGEEDFARVEEVVGQDVEAMRLLGEHGQILEHADRDAVAERRCLVAELEARRLGLG